MDSDKKKNGTKTITRATSVDCEKDVKSWKSLRSLAELMVPCYGCPSVTASPTTMGDSETGSTVTGTIFGYRNGRVSFCVQEDPRSAPLLLLEFAMPTYVLAREMRHGLLRIALECEKEKAGDRDPRSLFSEPRWTLYCNGRKVGFAVRRNVNEGYASIWRLMRSISVGAGVIPAQSNPGQGKLLYMRATYQRVIGSSDAESFHMLNPDGNGTGQELSVFLLRS